VAKEGFGYLYKGLGAGLLRQATYTTARLGIFRSMMDVIEKDRPSTFAEKVSTQTHAHAHDTGACAGRCGRPPLLPTHRGRSPSAPVFACHRS